VLIFPLIGVAGIISILVSRRKNRGEALLPLPRQQPLDELDSVPQSRIPASDPKATAPPLSVKYTLIVGSLMTLFGLFLASVFAPLHVISEWKLEEGPVTSVPGTVVTAEKTNSKENRSPIYQCTFSYQTEDGSTRQGTAYRNGSTWRENEKIEVTYLSSDPSVALPKGARMDPFGKGGLLVLLFPILGVQAIFKGLRMRSNILKNGAMAKANV